MPAIVPVTLNEPGDTPVIVTESPTEKAWTVDVSYWVVP